MEKIILTKEQVEAITLAHNLNDDCKDEREFLIQKGLIKEGCKDFIIKGDFGEVSLLGLLYEYGIKYFSEHNESYYDSNKDY